MFDLVELMQRYSNTPKTSQIGHFAPGRPVPLGPSRIHNAQRRLGPDVIARLVADYQAGTPTTALTTKYHLGKGTVLRLLRTAGIQLRAQGQENIDLAQAVERYAAGWSLAKLATAYDCDAETVRKALKAAGVTLRPRNGR